MTGSWAAFLSPDPGSSTSRRSSLARRRDWRNVLLVVRSRCAFARPSSVDRLRVAHLSRCGSAESVKRGRAGSVENPEHREVLFVARSMTGRRPLEHVRAKPPRARERQRQKSDHRLLPTTKRVFRTRSPSNTSCANYLRTGAEQFSKPGADASHGASLRGIASTMLVGNARLSVSPGNTG